MSQESQGVDHYAAVLADLRAKRDQIDQAIQVIVAIRGGDMGAPVTSKADQSAPVAGVDGPGAFLGMTVVDATRKLLASRRKTLGNAEIVAALENGGLVMNSADKVNTVGSILMRRFNTTGDIVRVSRGIWGLQEWYGSRNFKKKTGKEPESADAPSDLDAIAPNDASNYDKTAGFSSSGEEDPWAPLDAPDRGMISLE